MTTEVRTENKGVVVLHKIYRAKVGGYTVYKNKVYRVVSQSGSISDFTYILESELNKERIVVKQPESGKLRELIKPSGYISC